MKIKATIQGQKKYERFVYSTIHTLCVTLRQSANRLTVYNMSDSISNLF